MNKQKTYKAHVKYGKRIYSGWDIIGLVKDRKSIMHKNWGVMPAAFLASMQFRVVMKQMGEIFEYDSKLKK